MKININKMKINIKESTMIRPAQDLPNQHLWLSNLDLIQERNHVPFLYFYKLKECSMLVDACKVLKEAMSKVIVPFYPVAGRLRRDDNGRLEINCNGEGVLFIEAEADSTVDELGDLMLNVEIPLLLIPSVDYSNNISSFPLFVVQVTKFRCGGLSLGFRWHHTLADGIGTLYFINTWCDVARGVTISIPPIIDRTLLHSQVPPNPKFKHIEYDKPLSINTTTTQNNIYQPNSKPNVMEIFKITPEQLKTLKTKVKSNNGITEYSSYQILTAHIWRCTCKARALSDDQATKLYIAIDGRSRLHPPIPLNYFGNTIFSSTPIALSEELLAEPLKETVERISNAIKRMDDEYLRSAIDYLEVLDDLKPAMRGSQSCRCPNLNIVSWMRLPFYDADFGMGKPIFVRPANPLEGKGYILRTPSNDGSWLLAMCLEPDHMESFKKLFYEFRSRM